MLFFPRTDDPQLLNSTIGRNKEICIQMPRDRVESGIEWVENQDNPKGTQRCSESEESSGPGSPIPCLKGPESVLWLCLQRQG